MANEVYIYTKLVGVDQVEADIQKIERHLLRLTQRMQQMHQTAQQTMNSARPAPNLQYDFSKLEQALNALTAQMQAFNSNANNMAQVSGRASQKVASMGRSVSKTSKSFGVGLKAMLSYTLGIGSLVALFGKLRKVIIDGFGNLAQFNGGLNPTNQALSRLKSSLTELKNSFTAAFNPILLVIEPILTRFISMISSVVNSIGMLIAAITGASKYTKAIAVQENFAKALAKTAQNAKNANKQLAGFDKLNVINSKDQAGGSVGVTDPNKVFKTVEIESGIVRIAERIRGLAATVFEALAPIRDFFMEELVPRFLIIGQQVLEGFGQAIAFLSPYFKKFYDSVLKPIGEFAGELFLAFIDKASKLFADLQKVFEEKGVKIGNILDALTKTAEMLWLLGFKPTIQFITGALGGFFNYVDDIIGDIIDIFDGLSDFLIGVFTGDWERAWNGIKKIFFGVWNGILDIYSAVVNGIIDGLNAISFEIPSWMPGGGTTFGFNLERLDVSKFKIPALASGTVVPRSSDEFLAKLGDNNRETEIVSPLSTMKQAFMEAMRDSGMQGNSEIVSLLRIIAAKELVVPTDDVFTAMQNKAYEFRMTNGTDAFL